MYIHVYQLAENIKLHSSQSATQHLTLYWNKDKGNYAYWKQGKYAINLCKLITVFILAAATA